LLPVFRNPNNVVINVVFAMVRCPHGCDFTLDFVHFWIKVGI